MLLEIYIDPEETDKLLFYSVLKNKALVLHVCVTRHPDSDVSFILLHHASSFKNTILIYTGPGNKQIFLNIPILAKDYGQTTWHKLMSTHARSHCDTASAGKFQATLKEKSIHTCFCKNIK